MAEELHDLAPFFVLDALDEADRVRFEAHLAGCAHCRAEVAELSETLAVMDIEPAESIPDEEAQAQQGPTLRPGPGAVADEDLTAQSSAGGTAAATPEPVGGVGAEGAAGGKRDSQRARHLSVWLTLAAVTVVVVAAVLILVYR